MMPPAEDIHAAIACLRRLTHAFSERRRQLAAAEGLSEHQWRVLEEISTEHFMPSMFARSQASSPAAVSKTLRQLVDKGLVSARIDATDGRQRRYVLTSRGKRALSNLRERREEAIAHVWQKLDPHELLAFTRFGNELTDRLEAYAHNANAD